jgi:hypothetical protein
MNAPHNFKGAPNNSASVPDSPAIVSPSVAGVVTAYSFRTAACSECDGNPWFGIGHGSRCEGCDGLGEVDCQCCDCGEVTAINDDGQCQRCHDADTLPLVEFQARYLGENAWRVEL